MLLGFFNNPHIGGNDLKAQAEPKHFVGAKLGFKTRISLNSVMGVHGVVMLYKDEYNS